MAVLEDAVAKELVSFVRELVSAEVENALKEHRYRGAWQASEKYKKHNRVTFDGSEWCCLRDSEGERPGQSLCWQMTVRKGKDGKDGKDARAA